MEASLLALNKSIYYHYTPDPFFLWKLTPYVLPVFAMNAVVIQTQFEIQEARVKPCFRDSNHRKVILKQQGLQVKDLIS